MKQALIFRTGIATCYDPETKTMCRFAESSNYGTKWYCALLEHERLVADEWGLLSRTDSCLDRVQGEYEPQ